MLVGPVEVAVGTVELGAQLAGGSSTGGLVRVSPGNNFQVPSGVLVLGAMPATLPSAGIATNAAQTWAMPANTAAAFAITDGTTTYYGQDTRTGVTAVKSHTFDTSDPSFAGASGSAYSLMNLAAFTLTLTGTTTVTAMHGLSLLVSSPTVTNVSAGLAVTTASSVQINGPLPTANATITNAFALDVPTYVSAGTSAAGIRVAQPSGATNNYAVALTTGLGIAAFSGVTSFQVTAMTALLTIGSLGSVIVPYDTGTGETDGKAGNLNGAIAVNNADSKIFARTGGAWKGVAIAGFAIPKHATPSSLDSHGDARYEGEPKYEAVIVGRKGVYHGGDDHFDETICFNCQEKMKPLEKIVLIGDRYYSDGGLHCYAVHLACEKQPAKKQTPSLPGPITKH